jgi:hypothetical protein
VNSNSQTLELALCPYRVQKHETLLRIKPGTGVAHLYTMLHVKQFSAWHLWDFTHQLWLLPSGEAHSPTHPMPRHRQLTFSMASVHVRFMSMGLAMELAELAPPSVLAVLITPPAVAAAANSLPALPPPASPSPLVRSSPERYAPHELGGGGEGVEHVYMQTSGRTAAGPVKE